MAPVPSPVMDTMGSEVQPEPALVSGDVGNRAENQLAEIIHRISNVRSGSGLCRAASGEGDGRGRVSFAAGQHRDTVNSCRGRVLRNERLVLDDERNLIGRNQRRGRNACLA